MLTAKSARFTSVSRRASRVVLDTKPFVLFVAAQAAPELIGGPELKQYSAKDGELLLGYLGQFDRFRTTPHVTTEVAYFLDRLGKKALKDRNRFKPALCHFLGIVEEQPVASGAAMRRGEFAWLDLADCTLLEVCGPEETLLSEDALLVNALQALGREAVNFTHMRTEAGLLP